MNGPYCLLRRLSCLVLPAALLLPSALAHAKDSVPDWVRSAAAQKLPVYSADTNAVVLLDDTIYTVAPDGTAIEHVRRVIKILRPQGRDDGLVYVPFDADRKIRTLHVWSISPDGHEFELNKNDIVEFGYPGQGNLYEDMRVKAARPAGRDPGGVVAYEYERTERPYIAETTWFFQDDTPRLSQVFTLELPAGFTYSTVWASTAKTSTSIPVRATARTATSTGPTPSPAAFVRWIQAATSISSRRPASPIVSLTSRVSPTLRWTSTVRSAVSSR